MSAVEALPAEVLAALSPAAVKALTPGPGRMIAARGMLPLPRPGELATVLYQIAATDPALAATAQATVDGLPDKVVAGALADATVDGRVLAWLVPRVTKSPALVEALILAPAVADATIVALAERATAAQVDTIVANEQRLLRCPDIIAALYGNANARMSTVDRAVELAARAGVRVAGISAWDELARLVTSAPAGASAATDDAAFAQALAGVATVADASVIPPTIAPARTAWRSPRARIRRRRSTTSRCRSASWASRRRSAWRRWATRSRGRS